MKKILTITLVIFMANALFAGIGEDAGYPELDTKKPIYGPSMKTSDLKGKVVFWEYWGINCPPCRASYPHLVDMQTKFGKTGAFTVVASHVQGMSPEVEPFLKKNKVNFSVYQFESLQGAPCPGGIPSAVIVGGDGKVLFQGSPFDDSIEKTIKNAIDKAVEAQSMVTGTIELSKYKSMASKLKFPLRNVESSIAKVRENNDDEAVAICKAVDEWIDTEKVKCSDLIENDPLGAAEAIKNLKVAAPSAAEEFNDQLAKIESNRSLQSFKSIAASIERLEKSAADGKSIRSMQVDSIQKRIDALSGSADDELVSKQASALKARLEALPAE